MTGLAALYTAFWSCWTTRTLSFIKLSVPKFYTGLPHFERIFISKHCQKSAVTDRMRLANLGRFQLLKNLYFRTFMMKANVERKPKKMRKTGRQAAIKPVIDIVLQHDIDHLKAQLKMCEDTIEPHAFEKFQEFDVSIHAISSLGDGLGVADGLNHIFVVPFTVSGDLVRARVYRTFGSFSLTDHVETLQASTERDNSLIRCKYFGKCSGCQFQMMPYASQLEHKRAVIERAYSRFSNLSDTQVPSILSTVASPKEYNYRTKVTPHYDVPKGGLKTEEQIAKLAIGFIEKGRKRVMDIEECPIATETLNQGLTSARQSVRTQLRDKKRGATLLLRESKDDKEQNICITDHRKLVTEYVGNFKFMYPAGSFFQNNNSVLPSVVDYIRTLLSPYSLPFLVDAYCGSGLFSISLSGQFDKVMGIEISAESVQSAIRNASLNNLDNCNFITGTAESIFDHIEFSNQHTAVIIDPPRKGCDTAFLTQLQNYNPSVIVYVSCNVHTQARDIGFLMIDKKYSLQSVRGIDFFPQTHHVESIALLTKAS